MKILSNEKCPDAKLIHEDLFDEVFGRKLREFLGETLHNSRFKADDAKPGEALFGSGETLWSDLGA